MSNDDGFRDFQQRISGGRLLTAVEERELARRVQLGDEDARRTFVEANLRLVVHFARRVHHPDSRLSLMDLVQEGSLGLIRAVERFDPSRGVRFATYARWWINDALYTALEERAGIVRLPVDVRQAVKRLREAERDLEAELHRAPTAAQLADVLGVDVAEIARLRAAAFAPTSLDAAVGDDGESTLGEMLRDDQPEDMIASLLRAERDGRVGDLLEHLRPVERQIIERRYGIAGRELESARDVAKALGTSPAKLRAVEDLALRRLRAIAHGDQLLEAA
jgi:RNA polymerase primary sigma factor